MAPTMDNNEPVVAPLEEEVRFAVVMYGGIALCIYMGGITDILLDMVVATARTKDNQQFLVDYKNLSYTRRMLRRVAQLRTAYTRKDSDETPPDVPLNDPIRCKFVVDVLSG